MIALSAYVIIGMVLMVVAVASPGKEKRTRGFEGVGGDPATAVVFFLIAAFWPIWLITLFRKKEEKPGTEPRR